MRIKEIRKGLGISQTKLGEFCGVTKSTISQYENGKREPDIATLKRIAAAFGCSVDYLLGGDDENYHIYTKEEQKIFSMIADLEESELTVLSHFIDFLLSQRENGR